MRRTARGECAAARIDDAVARVEEILRGELGPSRYDALTASMREVGDDVVG